MVGVHEDLLLIGTDSGNFKIVNVDKIAGARFDKGTYLWTGAAIGAAVGFVAGVFYYGIKAGKLNNKSFPPKDPTMGTVLVFSLPCAVIGGFIGTLFRNIDSYDVSNLSSFYKSKELKYIMEQHEFYR